jgi:wobble nucleotide-excising tRNase
MLEKLISVTNTGCLQKLDNRGDTTFGRLTLIFGYNGDGKSTLASVLRAAGARTSLASRQRLGATEPPAVHIRHAGQNLKLRADAWDGPTLAIDVFDREFVDRNVHIGGEVQSEQKQNLLQLALGEAEVSAAREVEALARKIADVTGERSALLRTLEPLAASHQVAVDTFLRLAPVANPDGDLAKLDVLVTNAKQAAPIRDRALLVALPPLPRPDWQAMEGLLGTAVASLSKEASEAVAAHIDHLGASRSAAAAWIQEGLRYQAASADCPYCGQSTRGIGLVASYAQYFSNVYEAFLSKLRSTKEGVGRCSQAWAVTERAARDNEKSSDFWRSVTASPTPSIDLESTRRLWSDALGIADALLMRKLADPMQRIAATEEVNRAKDLADRAAAEVHRYNAAVAEYNRKITDSKAQVANLSLAQLDADKAAINARSARHQPSVAAIVAGMAAKDAEKLKLETLKSQARDRLEKAKARQLDGFEQEVNRSLTNLGAKFHLRALKTALPGGRPCAEYFLDLGGGSIDATRRGDGPSFRTVLSDGDKSTLALAMFLASAKLRSDIAHRTYVLDDPMTSLDENRTHATRDAIDSLAQTAGQVVVLSHQPRFLLRLGEQLPAAERKTLRIDGVGQALIECDLEAECMSDYNRRILQVRQFATGGSGDPDVIRGSIRIILEEHLRVHFPLHWQDTTCLGAFIAAAKADASVSSHLDLAALERMNAFSSPSHHARGAPRFAAATPDEVRNYASTAVKFITTSPP